MIFLKSHFLLSKSPNGTLEKAVLVLLLYLDLVCLISGPCEPFTEPDALWRFQICAKSAREKARSS